MKYALRLEELGMFLLAIFLFSLLQYSWWLFLVLILLPDLSMLGYLINPEQGAVLYNLFHHKGIALVFYLIGIYLISAPLQLFGIILFAHSSLDRALGYGLKYSDSFRHTHLGMIGKKSV
jgi:hypothetical protein